MFTAFIKGSKEIQAYFGYFPSFHDDYIESIEITSKTIIICIRMESSEVNLKPNANERVKLTFGNVKKFSFEGELYDCVSIIFDMVFEKKEEEIITKIETSLGIEGVIHSEDVSIELLS